MYLSISLLFLYVQVNLKMECIKFLKETNIKSIQAKQEFDCVSKKLKDFEVNAELLNDDDARIARQAELKKEAVLLKAQAEKLLGIVHASPVVEVGPIKSTQPAIEKVHWEHNCDMCVFMR